MIPTLRIHTWGHTLRHVGAVGARDSRRRLLSYIDLATDGGHLLATARQPWANTTRGTGLPLPILYRELADVYARQNFVALDALDVVVTHWLLPQIGEGYQLSVRHGSVLAHRIVTLSTLVSAETLP